MSRLPRVLFPFAVAAIAIAAGCGSPPGPDYDTHLPSVTGTITLDGATTVPANSELAVRLVDLSRTDTARVVVEQTISAPEEFPYHYRLYYRPNTIAYAHDYGVEAAVTVNGRAVWTQTDPNPVLTKSRPVVANIVLHQGK